MHDAAREQARHSQKRRFEVFQAAHLDWRRHWQQNSFLDVRAKSAEEKSRAAQTSALYEAASIHTVGSLHRVLHCQNLNPSCCCAAKATQFPASPEIGQQATPQDGAFTRAWKQSLEAAFFILLIPSPRKGVACCEPSRSRILNRSIKSDMFTRTEVMARDGPRRHGPEVQFEDSDFVLWTAMPHIIKGRPFGVGFECLAHSLQERNTLYD